jgi:hypothetical protein
MFMRKWLIITILTAGLLAPAARSANLVLIPVDAFGRVLNGCNLEGFQKVSEGKERPQQYQSNFDHLTGRNLPLGRYDTTIRCGDSLLLKHFRLSYQDQVALVPRDDRILTSDHTKPKLSIEMDPSQTSGEAWWISFLGLYNDIRAVSPFDFKTGRFELTDPEPGSYVVTIGSEKGYSCAQQIDLVEFTRLWRFDPGTCSFRLDEYAHIVGGHSKDDDPWYPQMKLRIDQLFKAMREAAQTFKDGLEADRKSKGTGK